MVRYVSYILISMLLLNSLIVGTIFADQATPSELLAESKQVFDECSMNEKESTYRDCQCYADAYLAERQKQPEQRYISTAKKAVNKMCLNLQNIYTYELNQCIRDSVSETMREERKEENTEICHCKSAFLKENIENETLINHMTINKLNKAFTAPCVCLVNSPDRNCTHPKLTRGYIVPAFFQK